MFSDDALRALCEKRDQLTDHADHMTSVTDALTFKLLALEEETEVLKEQLSLDVHEERRLRTEVERLNRDIAAMEMLRSNTQMSLTINEAQPKLTGDELRHRLLAYLTSDGDWHSVPDVAATVQGACSYDVVQRALRSMWQVDKSLERDTSKRFHRYKVKDGWALCANIKE